MPAASAFEMYVKEFELRLKLIETIGKWNKDMAEAEVQWANARLTHARAATIEAINRELRAAMIELKREERRATDRLARAESEAKKTARLVTGAKPPTAVVFSQTWAAFDWFLGESDPAQVRDVLRRPASDAHRRKANFVSMLVKKPIVEDAPMELTNFGLLLDWMRQQYAFFRRGSDVHELVLQAMSTVNESRATVVEKLEQRQATAAEASYKKLGELRKFLGLPAAAEKTPSVAMN